MRSDRIPVLVVGAGPVGMMLGIELASRGVAVSVVDQSREPPRARANLVAARSMEFFRRLGFADRVRSAGLPPDYPHDTAYRTCFVGEELFRVVVPSRAQVAAGAVDEAVWPTPEPSHRINQMYLEQILTDQARHYPHLELRRGLRLVSLTQTAGAVDADLEDSATGERRTVTADWVVGCDGTRSTVRRQLGLRYAGVDQILRVLSVYFRSRELHDLDLRPAWMTFTFNPHHVGAITAIDGEEFWVSHHHFPPDTDVTRFDPAEVVAATVGRPIALEVLDVIPWTARAMVTERYRSGRVFLAGDAAHDWVPAAGFGMNAGIGDAVDLAWKLAAVQAGWGGPRLLDSYELERRPVGAIVAKALSEVGGTLFTLEQRLHVDEPGEAGRQARDELRRILPAIERGVHQAVGLNFGIEYAGSSIVCPDGSQSPPFSIRDYDPQARPGARMPHLRLADGTPLLDRLGRGFTLLRVGEDAPDPDPLSVAAATRAVPLEQLVLDVPEADAACRARLVLVRPDQHVAWRGDELPGDCLALLDRVRGAG